MKIIKQGLKPENRTYRVTCYNCDTIFEFERHEAQLTPDQRDGDYLTIDCPVCSYLIRKDVKQYNEVKNTIQMFDR